MVKYEPQSDNLFLHLFFLSIAGYNNVASPSAHGTSCDRHAELQQRSKAVGGCASAVGTCSFLPTVNCRWPRSTCELPTHRALLSECYRRELAWSRAVSFRMSMPLAGSGNTARKGLGFVESSSFRSRFFVLRQGSERDFDNPLPFNCVGCKFDPGDVEDHAY